MVLISKVCSSLETALACKATLVGNMRKAAASSSSQPSCRQVLDLFKTCRRQRRVPRGLAGAYKSKINLVKSQSVSQHHHALPFGGHWRYSKRVCSRPLLDACFSKRLLSRQNVLYSRPTYTYNGIRVEETAVRKCSRLCNKTMEGPQSVGHTCNICLDTLGANGGVSTLLCGESCSYLSSQGRSIVCIRVPSLYLTFLMPSQATHSAVSAFLAGKPQAVSVQSAVQTNEHLREMQARALGKAAECLVHTRQIMWKVLPWQPSSA